MSDDKIIYLTFDHRKLSFPATKLFAVTPVPNKGSLVGFDPSVFQQRPSTMTRKKKQHSKSTVYFPEFHIASGLIPDAALNPNHRSRLSDPGDFSKEKYRGQVPKTITYYIREIFGIYLHLFHIF